MAALNRADVLAATRAEAESVRNIITPVNTIRVSASDTVRLSKEKSDKRLGLCLIKSRGLIRALAKGRSSINPGGASKFKAFRDAFCAALELGVVFFNCFLQS